jgi:hypothetical protein
LRAIVAVLLLAPLAACGGGGKKGGEAFAPPSTTAVQSTVAAGAPMAGTGGGSASSAPVESTTPAPAQPLNAFRTPSDNIGCSLYAAQSARCDIHEHSWSPPPKPADCPLDWGFGLQVASTGQGSFICAGDTAFDPSSPVLGYGQRAREGSFLCASDQAGVTCTNGDNGHGFFLSRDNYRVF